MKCSICGSEESYIALYNHDFTIKGKEIKFRSERRFCSECNNLIYDAELDNNASKKALEIYNKEYGIPKEDIIKLRKNYNLSQEQFAKIIGCAKKTLISYEKGTSIPNDNFYITLRSLIDNPEIINNFIAANKNSISNNEYQQINSKIKPFLSANGEYLYNKREEERTNFNGYTPFNLEKIKNMIIYFSEESILKTKLLKEMFYADFLNYKTSGTSITGLEYVKLPFGPVPDDYEEIIKYCCIEKLINYDIEYESTADYEYHRITSLKSFNGNVFSQSELATLKKVKEYFKKYNSKEIVEKSHQEKAFLNNEYYKKIGYEYSFDIEI